jgi:hypothetical protein
VESFEKLFDLLKTRAWLSLSASLSMFVFIYLEREGIIDSSPFPLLVLVAWFAGIVLLAPPVASVFEHLSGWTQRRLEGRQQDKKVDEFKESFRSEIPRLSDRERVILGYLRHYNRTSFEARYDGGYASSLIAKGYILRISPGQPYDAFRHPFQVNPHLWEIIRSHEKDLPHQPVYRDRSSKTEIPPWVIPVV